MPKTIELKVKGMSCEHCNMRVKKALNKINDVVEVKADYKKGVAVITLEEDSSVSIDDLIKAVNDTEIYTAEKS
jgi:copper chaperone CopZ